MIILNKENHTKHVSSREEAQKLVDEGYQILKNKLGGPKIVKSEPKKNMKKILHKTVFSKAALFPQQFMTEHQKLTLHLNKKQYNLTNLCNKTNLARYQTGKEEEAVVVFDNRDVFGINEQQVGD